MAGPGRRRLRGAPWGSCTQLLPAPRGVSGPARGLPPSPGRPQHRGMTPAPPSSPGRPQHPGMLPVLPPLSQETPALRHAPSSAPVQGDVRVPGGTLPPIIILPTCTWGGERVRYCWALPKTPAENGDHPTGGSWGGSPQALRAQGCLHTGHLGFAHPGACEHSHPQHTHHVSGWTRNLHHLHVHTCVCAYAHTCAHRSSLVPGPSQRCLPGVLIPSPVQQESLPNTITSLLLLL